MYDFNADVSLAPAAVSLYLAGGGGVTVAKCFLMNGQSVPTSGVGSTLSLRRDNVHKRLLLQLLSRVQSRHPVFVVYCHRCCVSRQRSDTKVIS